MASTVDPSLYNGNYIPTFFVNDRQYFFIRYMIDEYFSNCFTQHSCNTAEHYSVGTLAFDEYVVAFDTERMDGIRHATYQTSLL